MERLAFFMLTVPFFFTIFAAQFLLLINMSENKRESFGGKLSVILVAAGSAIGLGAIWRFPYIAGAHGGAAFLLVFLLSVLVARAL